MKKHTIILIALLLLALCACSSNDLQGTTNNTDESDMAGSNTVYPRGMMQIISIPCIITPLTN